MSNSSLEPLLATGGIYPVIVPVGWRLLGPRAEDVSIPTIAGAPFHRILGKGDLLAVEARPSLEPQVITLRVQRVPGWPAAASLDEYVQLVLASLIEASCEPHVETMGLTTCALSQEPCGRVVVARGDGRVQFHYLARDRVCELWELVYLVRASELPSWRAAFAEIEGATPVLAS